MKIELDYEMQIKIREQLWAHEKEKWGHELHRTDIIYCPLKAYCRLTDVPPKYTDELLSKLIVGEVAHVLIERAFPLSEVHERHEGCEVHYDFIFDTCPVEIKTTTATILNKHQIPKEWIDQLVLGLALRGTPTGYLLIFSLMTKVISVWKIELTEKELEQRRAMFIRQVKLLRQAVEERKPELLEPKKIECKSCIYNYAGGCPVV